MNEVDDRIRAARAAITERDRAKTIHAHLLEEIEAQAQVVDKLGAELTDEQKDVKRYERGVWAFLYDLFADRDARLTKEQLEAAAAEVRYREAVAARDELRAQADAIAKRVEALASAERDLAAARDAKRAMLAGSPVGDEIDGIAGQIGSTQAELASVEEALAAGERARQALVHLSEVLDSAKSWGTADVLVGGMLMSWAKREKLDQARSLAGAAQAELIVFQRELSDVGVALEAATVAAADHHRFLDVWFDNIFSDLAVQDRIEESQRTCTDALTEVSLRLGWARDKRDQLAAHLRELERQQQALLDPS